MAMKFDFDTIYIIDKPVHKRTAAYDKWWFFELKERNGNEVTFKSRKKINLKDYKGKIMTNPKTGDEICFITIGINKYMLDAKYNMSPGRPLSKETLNATVEDEWDEEKQEFTRTDDCNITLKEFLNKKARQRKV